MLERIKEILSGTDKLKYIALAVGAAVIISAVALLVYYAFFRPEPVQTTSQQQAETAQGVQQTANEAGVTLTDSQAKAVAKEIQYIYKTEKVPVYTVTTTGDKAKTAASEAQKQAKADFSIVTDKDNPDKTVDLNKLSKDQTVNLNQYNVQAYKSVIREVSYSPQEKRAGFTISKKITKDGQYIGVGADYDIDDGKVYAKIVYQW